MQDLVFLHGALGSSRHWEPVIDLLGNNFNIHNLDFPGHGGSSDTTACTCSALCEFVRAYTNARNLQNFGLIGYSMGGYVGLQLASENLPGMSKLLTLAVKTNWNPDIAGTEAGKLSAEYLQPLAEKLEALHGKQWLNLLPCTAGIMQSIGHNPLMPSNISRISIPFRMLLGENDKMVGLEETLRFTEASDKGSFHSLSGQGHLLEKMDARMLADEILNFLTA